MRRYETIFIVRPTVTEDEITGIIEKVNSIIENDGGSFLRLDKWGLKKLAYLIKKESQGYFIYVDYAGIPSSVAEMERIFRIDDNILKYLTVKLADSCDPDTIKEQLAQEELAAKSSAESEEVIDDETDKSSADTEEIIDDETAKSSAESEEIVDEVITPAEEEEQVD